MASPGEKVKLSSKDVIMFKKMLIKNNQKEDSIQELIYDEDDCIDTSNTVTKFIDDTGLVLHRVPANMANEDGSFNLENPIIVPKYGFFKGTKLDIIEQHTHKYGNIYGKFINEDGDSMWVLIEGKTDKTKTTYIGYDIKGNVISIME